MTTLDEGRRRRQQQMKLPTTTGLVARALDTSEPRLNDLIRRRKIDPPPPIVSGRRVWELEHLLEAAESLGLLTDDLRTMLSLAPAEAPGEARRPQGAGAPGSKAAGELRRSCAPSTDRGCPSRQEIPRG